MAWYSKPLGLLGRLPPATVRRVAVERDLAVPGSGGVTLLADLYRPDVRADGRLPTLLVRSPYGRRGKWGAVYGQLFAERGYQVLVQSTRGTYGSGGAFEPMVYEAADGAATVRWLREQPWFSGEFVVLGASYLAFAGWAIGTDPPPELRGLVSHVGPHEWKSAIYPGGAFALDFALTWTANRQRRDDPDSLLLNLLRSRPDVRAEVGPAFVDLPLARACARVLDGRAPWFGQWLEHGPDDDAYWQAYDASAALHKVDVPVLLLGGWHDLFLEQTLQQHQALTSRGVPVTLAVGPWTHHGLEKDWPAMISRTLAWLGSLFGDGTGLDPDPEVYVGGAGHWARAASWPPAGVREQRWHPQPGGVLSLDPPHAGPPDTYTYDPAGPTPTVGGATMREDAGSGDNRELEQRPDVLTYSSPPLESDLQLLGAPVASLRVSSSAVSFDCFARLCAVAADGTSTNVCDGIVRVPNVPKDTPRTVVVRLAPTAHRFSRGQRLRLQVAGGSHPRFARNLGTGSPPGTGTQLVVAHTAVHHDPDHPSTFTLPVRAAPLDDPPVPTRPS